MNRHHVFLQMFYYTGYRTHIPYPGQVRLNKGICDNLKFFDVVPQIDKMNLYTIVVWKYFPRNSEANIFTSELRGGFRQMHSEFKIFNMEFQPQLPIGFQPQLSHSSSLSSSLSCSLCHAYAHTLSLTHTNTPTHHTCR